MGRLDELKTNFKYVLKEEGVHAAANRFAFHTRQYLGRFDLRNTSRDTRNDFVDVLFINGCDYCVPHPIRYRVDHQAEQLEAVGVSTRIVNAWEINEDFVRIARVFIIFRCPYADVIGDFIQLAHSLNKVVLYDIDDLVIDTVYTDQIPFLDSMSPEERAQYDDGVRRMGKTLTLCDGAITTTDQLAHELSKYVPEVFVNRNVASEEMFALSERAVYERDVLPKLDGQSVKPEERHRWKLACKRARCADGFGIGYFSGSITHNDDFAIIQSQVVRFMSDYEDVKLYVVGELDLPEELKPFEDRIVRLPFSPWRRLPKMVSEVDVNLIPLADTVFNRAKSENKWVEAGLVKVASVASNVGALKDSITDGVNGLLVNDGEWYEALVRLHDDAELRGRLAKAAYDECSQHHITCGTGMPLAEFIRSKQRPNAAFVFPGLDISGGVLVAMKHGVILRNRGYDVTFIAPDSEESGDWCVVDDARIPVVCCKDSDMRGRFDKMIATMWTTLSTVKDYGNAQKRYYLVQNLENGFYAPGSPDRAAASSTYGDNPNTIYCTISRWCEEWLRDDYCKSEVRFARNGIDLSLFTQTNRDWSGKIRILVEGDSSSEYKNVDESFRIVAELPEDKFEIWYLSYKGEPKSWYRVDKYLQAVPHEEVGKVYAQCHILLKTSILESFSYPPLEMMATGGLAVVARNGGNAEFLVDGENSLLFDSGEEEKAVDHILRLSTDLELREHLRLGGLATAAERSWDHIEDDIVALYQ